MRARPEIEARASAAGWLAPVRPPAPSAALLTLLGIGVTGAAATALTLTFAGLVFGVVVAVATISAVVIRRRRARQSVCGDAAAGETGPVPVELLGTPPDRF